MAAEPTRITLRVPADIYKTAQAAADIAGVSMNEYIVTAIAAYSGHKPDLEKRVEQIETIIGSYFQQTSIQSLRGETDLATWHQQKKEDPATTD